MQIRFCFEIEYFEANTYNFVNNHPDHFKLLEISRYSSLNDISLFIASLLSFNELDLNSQFIDALFIKDELALVGGLLFKENNINIGASCCADFQDWIYVVRDIKEQSSPWMGHDPSPWFEFKGEEIILWSDEQESDNIEYIKFTQQEFDQQLTEAKAELHQFLEKIEQWSMKHYPINPERLILGMKHYFLL